MSSIKILGPTITLNVNPTTLVEQHPATKPWCLNLQWIPFVLFRQILLAVWSQSGEPPACVQTSCIPSDTCTVKRWSTDVDEVLFEVLFWYKYVESPHGVETKKSSRMCRGCWGGESGTGKKMLGRADGGSVGAQQNQWSLGRPYNPSLATRNTTPAFWWPKISAWSELFP